MRWRLTPFAMRRPPNGGRRATTLHALSDAEATRKAEAVRRERAMSAYQHLTQDAQQFMKAVLANLPDGDTLTQAREWRDRLTAEARELRQCTSTGSVRRPLDPLAEIVAAM